MRVQRLRHGERVETAVGVKLLEQRNRAEFPVLQPRSIGDAASQFRHRTGEFNKIHAPARLIESLDRRGDKVRPHGGFRSKREDERRQPVCRGLPKH